jgi:two-component system LytT family response regulator
VTRTQRIRALVVDDEPLARQNLRVLLAADPDVEIVAECGTGREALAAIASESPDLVFLDIQMPEMDGFEVLERLDARTAPAVVFVTAYDQYAIRAFEVRAIDYLLKPFDDGRFRKALEQAKDEIARRDASDLGRKLLALLEERDRADAPSRPHPYLTRILVKTPTRVSFVPVGDVDWIEAAGAYVQLHVGARTHLLRETMTALEEKLDPDRFVRIHRSTIVNVGRVVELRPDAYGDYLVALVDGTQLKMSRGRREHVEARLSFS